MIRRLLAGTVAATAAVTGGYLTTLAATTSPGSLAAGLITIGYLAAWAAAIVAVLYLAATSGGDDQ